MTSLEPVIEFIDEVGGLYFRSILLRNRGDTAAQHTHEYDHVTYVGNGCVVAYADEECIGEVWAGHAIEIKAGIPHKFVAILPDTRLTCVHNVESANAIKAKGL